MTSEPAFPSQRNLREEFAGLTKREYAAIEMAKGILSSLPNGAEYDMRVTVELAISHADALIAELEKP